MREIFEVEIKIPIENEVYIKEILQARGKRLTSEIQSDMYFDHPCRSFSDTDESVRVRNRTALDSKDSLDALQHPPEITYKGPKIDGITKTRLEFTSAVSDSESIIAILHHTGFTNVATITKRRVFYIVDGISISLDDVDDVGLFLEFELIAQNRDEIDGARARIIELVDDLGLDSTRTVRESYLELYLKPYSP